MAPKLAEWFSMTPKDLLGVGLAAGGAGIGARLLRHAYDLGTGRDINPPNPLPQITPAEASYPVKVSPDEAAELERQGVKVKHRPSQPKLAGVFGDGTFMDNLALSVAGTGAAYGGWKLLDNAFDGQRRAAQQKKLDVVRNRVQNLLNGSPAAVDAPLHAQMKAAEEAYFDKKASLFSNIASGAASGVLNLASDWAIPIGVGGTALGLAAYNQSNQDNKFRQASKAIREYYERRKTTPPQAAIEPYVEDEDKAEPALMPPIGGPKIAQLQKTLAR